ncbi:hypothetical protein BH18ACT14_BH18ACT14_09910 [soil metagenome]
MHVHTPAEAIDLLRTDQVEELSLDHDLGLFTPEGEVTGNDVVLWIEEQVVVQGFRPPSIITVHSGNPPAHERRQRGIDSIMRRSTGP